MYSNCYNTAWLGDMYPSCVSVPQGVNKSHLLIIRERVDLSLIARSARAQVKAKEVLELPVSSICGSITSAARLHYRREAVLVRLRSLA